MDHRRLQYMRDLLLKAAVRHLEIPLWRFDGEAIQNLNELALTLGIPEIEAKTLLDIDRNTVPGWEGSVGPFPHQYGQPHVYARDVHSGAGNCVCGRADTSSIHVTAKDVYGGIGAGPMTRGIGTKPKHAGVYQRANALAYGNRRRRRRKREKQSNDYS